MNRIQICIFGFLSLSIWAVACPLSEGGKQIADYAPPFTSIEVIVRAKAPEGTLAFANLIWKESIIIRSFEIYQGPERLEVGMPRVWLPSGEYRTVAHIADSNVYEALRAAIVTVYEERIWAGRPLPRPPRLEKIALLAMGRVHAKFFPDRQFGLVGLADIEVEGGMMFTNLRVHRAPKGDFLKYPYEGIGYPIQLIEPLQQNREVFPKAIVEEIRRLEESR